MPSERTIKFSAGDAISLLSVVENAVGAVPTIGPILQGSVGALVGIAKIVQKVEANKDRRNTLLERIHTICRILEPYKSPQDVKSLRPGRLFYRLARLSKAIMACQPDLKELESFHWYHKYLKSEAIAGHMDQIDKIIQNAIQAFELEGSIRREVLLDKTYTAVHKTEAAVQRNGGEILPPDFMDLSAPKCLENTRVEVLKELRDWSDGLMHSERRIVWIHGPPGSGKSTIARTMVSELENKGMLAAFFFFSRDHEKRRNPHFVFPSIARQLALFSHDFKSKAYDVQSKYSDVGVQSLELQLKRLILEPIGLISTPDRRWIIILDALDECEDEAGAKEILTLLGLYLDKLPHVQFLITSRPESQIKSRFDSLDTASLEPHAQPVNLFEIDIRTVSGDIRRYLDHELAGEWARREDWFPASQDLDSLRDMADGLFIYAATCVKLIKSAPKRSEMLRSLIEGKRYSNASPLVALNALYLQIVEHALEAIDEGAIDTFRRVIGTIVYLRNPLSIRDLSSLLGMEDTVVHSILLPLHTVIFIPKSDSSEIKFYHQSFRDFLVSSPEGLPIEELNVVHDFMVLHDQSDYDTYLAENCFKTFNSVLHRNMSGVDDLTKLNSEIPDLGSRIDEIVPPYVRYACLYWSSHVRASPTARSTALRDQLEKWTRKDMMSWLESLSLCGGVHESVSTLNEAERWYKECPSPREEVIELLVDGQRFVQMFIEPIERSAGHIYLSALPFTPDCQLRSQYYSSDFPKSVMVVQGRNTEWSPLLLNIHGHESSVTSVAFSPDGRRVVSGSQDSTVRIWSSETGKLLSTLEGHTNWVTSVAFSPDGRRVVSGSRDNTVRIWSSETGKVLSTLEGHTREVTSVAFSPDGRRVVSGSYDKTVRIWSSETGKVLSTLEGHTNWVNSVAFSPDGRRVVSGSHDETVRIWSSETGMVLSTLKGDTSVVTSVAFSPDGGRVVSGSWDNTVRIWSSETGKVLSTLEGHTNWVNSVAFSPDGRRVVSSSNDRTVRIWSSETGKLLSTLEGHTNWVTSVAFSPDGRRVVSGSHDDMVRIWSSETGKVLSTLEGHTNRVSSVAFSPDGGRVVSGSWDDTVRIWSSETGKLLSALEGHTESVISVAFSPDSRRVVSGSDDNTVRIWSSETGELLSTLKERRRSARDVALSLDGDSAAGRDDSSTLSIKFHIDPSGWVRDQTRSLCWLPLRNRPTDNDAMDTHMNLVCSGSGNGVITILDFSPLFANI